jgi:meiosis induction protein kinase IME2/SME1
MNELAHKQPCSLTDRFEILSDIGDGSFGTVALARVRAAGSGVARRGTVVSRPTASRPS